MRTALRLIRRLTLEPDAFGAEDVDTARQDLTDDAILDVIEICVAFNIIDRVADAMGFAVPAEEHLRTGARLIKRVGYGLPAILARTGAR